MKTQRKIVLVLLSIGAWSSAQADVVIKMKEATKFVGDDAEAAASFLQSNSDAKEVTLWSGTDAFVRVDKGGRMISRADLAELFILNDAAKSCRKIAIQTRPLKSERDSQDFKKTGESHQIGEWSTDVYTLSVPGGNGNNTNVKSWISSEATLGLDRYHDYLRKITPEESYWMVQSVELGGYPVRQEIHFGPVAAWTEIESISESEPPAGIYDIPDDYEGCAE